MLFLAAYIFQYGLFILCGLMFAWSFALFRNRPFTKHFAFRIFPIVFAIIMLAHEAYSPIAITSPSEHTIIHPGDKVSLKVELNPAFISKLFPFVSLDLYRCYTCADSPQGISTEGTLTGSPYTFTIKIPQNQPAGEIYVNAYASTKIGEHPAMRSKGIGLVVQ